MQKTEREKREEYLGQGVYLPPTNSDQNAIGPKSIRRTQNQGFTEEEPSANLSHLIQTANVEMSQHDRNEAESDALPPGL